jgi:hypothetical protein
MRNTRRTLGRFEIRPGVDAIAAADGYLVEEAMSHYRWERRGLLGRLVRTPIAQESSQAWPSLRRAA